MTVDGLDMDSMLFGYELYVKHAVQRAHVIEINIFRWDAAAEKWARNGKRKRDRER